MMFSCGESVTGSRPQHHWHHAPFQEVLYCYSGSGAAPSSLLLGRLFRVSAAAALFQYCGTEGGLLSYRSDGQARSSTRGRTLLNAGSVGIISSALRLHMISTRAVGLRLASTEYFDYSITGGTPTVFSLPEK